MLTSPVLFSLEDTCIVYDSGNHTSYTLGSVSVINTQFSECNTQFSECNTRFSECNTRFSECNTQLKTPSTVNSVYELYNIGHTSEYMSHGYHFICFSHP